MPRLVMTSGCFDILHAGHVRMLNWARQQGDRLLVALNSDRSVRMAKGRRSFRDQDDRRETLLALQAVDDVVLFDSRTPCRLIERYRPAVWVMGPDHFAGEEPPRVAAALGADIVKFDAPKDISSTTIARRIVAWYGDRG